MRGPRASASAGADDGRLPDGRLGNHWAWRPEWAADRPHLMWYLTFEGDSGLREWVAGAQRLLADAPSLDLVPTDWLHCTVDDVGFVDELSPDSVDRVGRAGTEALRDWAAPALTLGPVHPMQDALVLHAEPAGELSRLRERLRAATVSVLGSDALPALAVFEPHVTIAYVHEPTDAAPLLDRVADVRDDAVAARPPVVRLASVTRRDRHYQWTDPCVAGFTPARA